MFGRFVGEMVGTALLLVFGVGLSLFGGPHADLLTASIGWGVVIGLLVFLIGPYTGAHFNPVVTLVMMVKRAMSVTEGLIYMTAQFVGGFLGGLAVVMVYRDVLHHQGSTWQAGVDATHLNATMFPNLSVGTAFLVEIALTATLIVVVLTVGESQRALSNLQVAGIVGMTIFLMVMVGGNLTGTSMNPVRSLYPALFAGGEAMQMLWLYMTAPFVGGLVGYGVYTSYQAIAPQVED